MQALYKRFSVIGGFALLLFVLIANALVTRRQLAVQNGTESWLEHTRQVQFELSQAESLIKDAETGQRGYLLTGDEQYLAPYNAAIAQIDPHIDKVSELTADNPSQQARIPMLRELAHAKLAELARTIALYKAGKPDDAKALVLSDVGLLDMRNIRKLVEEMEQEEARLEANRASAYAASVSRTVISIYVASALAALGLILLAYFILREIELREKHAQQLRAREEWFRVTLTSIGDGVIATDKVGRVTFLNPIAAALTGIQPGLALGKDITDVFPIFNEYTAEKTENPVSKVMALGQVVGLANHTVLKCSDGRLIPIEDSAAPIRDDEGGLLGVVLVFRDATIERKSQELLRKTEKLAAAARLSATVAHEINNPLEAVVNLVYMAKSSSDMPAEVEQHLTLAELELDRVAHITRQTLGFYRDTQVPEGIDMPELVGSVLKLYSNKLRSKMITVDCQFDDCPPVFAVASEIKQVVSNLVANAADAVGLHGRITVKLTYDQAAGEEVLMVIEDDGPGVPAEDEERIFEPFFTTKRDVGTGLGLWVSKEIVQRHGGSIHLDVDRNGSGGAAFKVILPSRQETMTEPVNGRTE